MANTRAKPQYRDGVGIVNPYDQFWCTDIFDDEAAAKAHFDRFWRGVKNAPAWEEFRVVPARAEIVQIDLEASR